MSVMPDEVRESLNYILSTYYNITFVSYAQPHLDAVQAWLDNLPQPPQPVYSHRNGETEPPEVQGHYWFRGLNTRTGHRVRKWVMGGIDKNMVFVYAYGWGRPEEFIGEWYGPIPEPGLPDDSATRLD